MEPRSLERGNAWQEIQDSLHGAMLQWSHVHSNVETESAAVIRGRAKYASMEPRSLERGNDDADRSEGGNCLLQWSHVHSNVETFSFSTGRNLLSHRFNGATFTRTWKPRQETFKVRGACQLQWSHVHSNVETAIGATHLVSVDRASMEPRSLERGNAMDQR